MKACAAPIEKTRCLVPGLVTASRWMAAGQSGAEPSNTTRQAVIKSLRDWVEEITQFLAQEKKNCIELGKLLHTAKRSLHYGEWSQLWRSGRIPFSKRKAEMLV